MAVTGSTLSVDAAPQADGRYWVKETHTVSGGHDPIVVYYLGDAGVDYAAVMAARVASLNAWLMDEEYQKNISSSAAPTFIHITVAQFVAKLREAYRSSVHTVLYSLSYWLQEQLVAGNITDAQCQTAFGLTAAQWNSFKTNKLIPRHDAWATLLTSVGQ